MWGGLPDWVRLWRAAWGLSGSQAILGVPLGNPAAFFAHIRLSSGRQLTKPNHAGLRVAVTFDHFGSKRTLSEQVMSVLSPHFLASHQLVACHVQHLKRSLWAAEWRLLPPVPISYRHCCQCQPLPVASRNNASASATDLATPAIPPAVSTAASHCFCSGVRRPVGVLTSMLVNTATC